MNNFINLGEEKTLYKLYFIKKGENLYKKKQTNLKIEYRKT